MGFSELGLNQDLIKAVSEQGYSVPTAVQAAAIPVVLDGRDLMAGAQTGTGKTAAFALPVLQRLCDVVNTTGPRTIRALILTPTRELAQQVYKSFNRYGQFSPLNCVLVYGGAAIDEQIEQLRNGADIVVATPGRLLDLIFRSVIDLSALQTLVLDEADRMLDMGFSEEIGKIMAVVPQQRQTLLFSATFDNQVFKFAKRLLDQPQLIEVDQRNSTAINVKQTIYNVDPERKREITAHLISAGNWQQVLVFTRTKQGADKLVEYLGSAAITAQAIHGDKSQAKRERALEDFRAGSVQVLVATDVAARGLDIDELKYVINYELPFNPEDYIHRIGRTGRAGGSGTAVSLLSEEERHLLEEIERVLDSRLLQQWLPGFEPDLDRVVKSSGKNSRGAQKKRARERALGKKPARRRR
ncbi:DEAD/DEAH box helicase [Amphritea sp. HPY]|uniref:DEAD/DEAH box helicase n=1 Tax=Amphritea sp. HPY TaxID=3421652 RepID=UPI003D7D33DA